NDAAAESQGTLIRHVTVNNRGRSVTAGGNSLTLTSDQTGAIRVSTTLGGGAVSRIELRSLGRAIGTVSGGSGNVSISAPKLAYGDNQLIPVAVFSDGTEVSGNPILVHRDTPTPLIGRTPLPLASRQKGIKGEFFVGQGGASIAGSTF